MIVKLPTKDELLDACNGTIRIDHPILHATHDLIALHSDRRTATVPRISEIDCSRAELVRSIDRWVTTHLPQGRDASYLHTETVGTVIDRLTHYRIDAHAALRHAVTEPDRHFRWQRLAELTVAYADLSYEIGAGLRKVPTLTYPAATIGHSP